MDTSTPKEALARAIAKFPSLKAFSDEIGVPYQTVQQWMRNGTPTDYCPDIEILTGGDVLCEELKPTVNWTYLRNSKRSAQVKPP